MSAYRCSMCGVNYPVKAANQTCPVCDEPTDYFSDLHPDKEPTVGDLEQHADTTAASIFTWRFNELWGAGYDSVTAELLASGEADLHRMVDAKRAGCSDALALSIFA